ncbi:MAG: EAL domain-containing protein [Oscillospiraceae bacterium]
MVILVLGILIVAIIAVFATGILTFQKRQQEEKSNEQAVPLGISGEHQTAPEEPEELVDLVDYFADYPEEEREKKKVSALADKKGSAEEFDRLSNLKVRRGYLLDCQNFLHNMVESGQKFALVYFDFNRFRFINTLRGFSTGDYVITRIAQEMKLILPEGAMMTRLSADHFAALIVYLDENQLQDIFERLRRAGEAIRSDIGSKGGLQLCMGVAITEHPGDYDIFKLIRWANIARHTIKLTKAETYSVYNGTMLSSFLYGESALEDYNEHQYADDFTLYLRPQMLMASKRVTACDSMVRWVYEDSNDPSYGNLFDGSILPASNLKVAYQICRTINKWRKAGNIPLPVMVGIGELDFYKTDIDAFFGRCMAEFQVEASLLTVVVSLHAIRLDPEIARIQAKKLTDAGLKLAICDIDRGVQSLEMLEGMQIDFLKLHKSFTQDLDRDSQRQEDVKRILSIAETLQCGTVFEGVDTVACMNKLSELGGTFAQGQYVGKPGDIDSFTEDMSRFVRGGHRDVTVILDDAALSRGEYKLF